MAFLKRTEPEPTAAPPPVGPETLRDGVLLARWYILYRLDEEMKRARRHDRSLSVMVARPMLIPGEQPTTAMLEAGAAAAQAAARSTDLLGWLDGDSILIVMPETKQADANVAVGRWRSEMWLRGRPVGGHKWQAAAIENPGKFESAEELVQAATEQPAWRDAA